MEQKLVQWLKRESALWAEDGIITPAQRDQIQRRYPEGKTVSLLPVFFAVIGAVLVGAGIILIFATNWWRLSVELRLFLAFLPLLLAQGLCWFIFKKRFDSAAFREGGAVFLALAFFAALALVGQIFHLPGDLDSYLLLCTIFTLPGAYFLRSKAAVNIYAAGAIVSAWFWPVWAGFILTALCLPFFYRECIKSRNEAVLKYLLFLLSSMLCNTMLVLMKADLTLFEISLLCCLVLLVLDALVGRFAAVSFFTAAKLFAVLCFTATLLILVWNIRYGEQLQPLVCVAAAVLVAVYGLLRRRLFFQLAAGDIFAAASVLLLLCANSAGAAACLLAAVIGIFFLIRGSRTLRLGSVNYGMLLIMALIVLRFFDSEMGLLFRGIIAVLLGIGFLCINLFISRKRRGSKK